MLSYALIWAPQCGHLLRPFRDRLAARDAVGGDGREAAEEETDEDCERYEQVELVVQ